MLKSIFDRNNNAAISQELYGTVVAQARLPVFFTGFGFPDTVMGRFDVLTLHVFLLCHRLGLEGQANADNLSQEVFDRFVDNLDVALRQLGIGDSSVPKKKKKMIRSFYGQIEDFNQPLKSRDEGLLCEAINKRFYENDDLAPSQKLAEYFMATSDRLIETKIKAYYRGKFSWLDLSGNET